MNEVKQHWRPLRRLAGTVQSLTVPGPPAMVGATPLVGPLTRMKMPASFTLHLPGLSIKRQSILVIINNDVIPLAGPSKRQAR